MSGTKPVNWLDKAEAVALAACGVSQTLAEVVVDPMHVARFGMTCGESPITPRIGAIAPPLYLAAVFGWEVGPNDDDLRPDGLAARDALGFDLSGGEILGAGQSVEINRMVRAGWRGVVTRTVIGVQRKQGRSGAFLLVEVQRCIEDAIGQQLCHTTELFIVRESR